jgi:hypothetical protein
MQIAFALSHPYATLTLKGIRSQHIFFHENAAVQGFAEYCCLKG